MSKNRLSYLVFAALLVVSMILSACAQPTPITVEVVKTVEVEKQVEVVKTVEVEKKVEVEKIVEVTPTPVPATATPAPVEIGTAENPIILALAPSANTQELVAGGEAIAAKLSEITGYTFKVTVPTNYAALVEAMGSGNAHVGFLPTVPYIVAQQKGYATVGLTTLRNGADHYAYQIVVNADRVADGTFTLYYDEATAANTADAATALAQFEKKKPCYTDPLSSSGYLVPAGFFAANKVKTATGAWVQGHPTIIKSIYLSPKGEICDFGTTFVDARTNVTTDLPDVNDKVKIVWVSDAIIPNDTISFITSMPADMRQKIVDAFLQIVSTEEGLQLLKNGGYSIGGLKAVDDSFFDDFRIYLESIKFDINSYK